MPVQFVRRESDAPPLTLAEFMGLFRVQTFEGIEAEVRQVRESFVATDSIRTMEEFRAAVVRFYRHWRNARMPCLRESTDTAEFDRAWFYLTSWSGHGMAELEAERAAINDYHGGFVGFINKVTDGLVRYRIDSYINEQFYLYLRDEDAFRERLIDELVDRYGVALLFPEHPHKSVALARVHLKHGMHRDHLRDRLQSLIIRLAGIQRLWRY